MNTMEGGDRRPEARRDKCNPSAVTMASKAFTASSAPARSHTVNPHGGS